jgi:hypothetical protein
MAAAAVTAAKLIERMLAIIGRTSEIVMGRVSQLGRASQRGRVPHHEDVTTSTGSEQVACHRLGQRARLPDAQCRTHHTDERTSVKAPERYR